MSKKPYSVVGMGAALVDVFAHVTEDELADIGSAKASMALISPEEAQALESRVDIHTRASGGSAGNTVAGIAALGLSTGFIGKVGTDALGQFFSDDLRRVQTAFAGAPHPELPTGRCLVLITPDAERTMHTLLGASVATSIDDLDREMLAQTEILFGEAYIWDSPSAREAFLHAAAIVRENGGRVALSLSDPFCVGRHHSALEAALESHVDIMLANLSEAEALFGTSDRSALTTAARAFGIEAAITMGANGALLISHHDALHVDAERVQDVVDLTGAGDQFAAGYLSGRALGMDLAQCGRRGTLAAAEVIRHIGPRPQNDVDAVFKAAGLAS
jgi:sugar/nucleoside kinase (ribokinase family)